MNLKILTWNIWHGKFPDKVLKHLRITHADIIGLQEVVESDTIDNLAKSVAKELNYHCAYFKAFRNDRHNPPDFQGNAILSRFPIQSCHRYLLNNPADYEGDPESEPRIAVEAFFSFGGNQLRVITTHLAYSSDHQPSNIRRSQVNKLVSLINGKRTLLLGDLNATPDSFTIRKVTEVMKHTDPKLSEKTAFQFQKKDGKIINTKLDRRIDYIFASPDLEVISHQVEQSEGSDHLPVSATIKL